MSRSPTAALLTAAELRRWLPMRGADSQKGANGHLLILAGSRGMSGAAVLSALGALRVGAGLVTVASPQSVSTLVAGTLPEVLTLGLPEGREGHLTAPALDVLLQYAVKHRVAAAAVGPGLAVAPAVGEVLRSLLKKWMIATVIDADGLNNLKPQDLRDSAACVLTPHPGEMARLLGIGIADVEKDRQAIARRTALDLGLVCLLKGHHTVISNGQFTRLNPTGNPAMATGGMGDVLTGMIGGLLAQKLAAFEAACAGAYLHGLAADLVHLTDRGLLASEVANAVPRALQKLRG